MNRLILIGNGFDLAHNLKTSYKDFVLDLFKREIMKTPEIGEKGNNHTLINRVSINDKGDFILFEVVINNGYTKNQLEELLQDVKSFRNLKDFMNTHTAGIKFPENKKAQNGVKIIKRYPKTIMQRSYDNLTNKNYNWVDIEGMYYQLLLNYITDKNGNNTYNDGIKDDIKFLNSELDFLREKLIEYLNEAENIDFDINYNDRGHFWNRLKARFIDNDIQKLQLKENEHFPNKIHILNFNYTETIFKYGNDNISFENKNAHVDYNFIHGNIKSKHLNPIIFGYGDETDDNYSILERLNDNELLRHIKSFGYFNTDNYQKLLRFIEQPEGYQVYVIGHSCGLSDRVMLKRIFEHENCKSIQIFYHELDDDEGRKKNDYMTRTQEISRHFDNKDIMREKIVPKNLSKPMSDLNIVKFN